MRGEEEKARRASLLLSGLTPFQVDILERLATGRVGFIKARRYCLTSFAVVFDLYVQLGLITPVRQCSGYMLTERGRRTWDSGKIDLSEEE